MSRKSSKEELRVVHDLNDHIRALHKICEEADVARLKAEAGAARLREELEQQQMPHTWAIAVDPAEPPAAARRNHMTEKEYLQKFVAFFLDATYRTISPQSAIDLFIEQRCQSGNQEPTDARWAVDEYGEGKK